MHFLRFTCCIMFLTFETYASQNQLDHDGNWYGTFVFENNVRITHTPTRIIFQAGEQLKYFSSYTFSSKTSGLFGVQALADGCIDRGMSIAEFRAQCANLGVIIKEGLFNEWTKTFKLHNGLEVTHTPKLIIFKNGGRQIEMSQFHFQAGPSVFEVPSNDQGFISIEMDLDTFRSQLKNMSPIKMEHGPAVKEQAK